MGNGAFTSYGSNTHPAAIDDDASGVFFEDRGDPGLAPADHMNAGDAGLEPPLAVRFTAALDPA